MTRRRADRRDEAGTTLVELIVTVAIMGIAFVGAVGGILTALIGTDYQTRGSTSGIVLTSAAETIVADSTPYAPCAAPDAYQDRLAEVEPPSDPASAAPARFIVTVVDVLVWDGDSRFVPSASVASCTPPSGDDNGVQLIQLKVTPPPGPRANDPDLLDVVKRRTTP